MVIHILLHGLPLCDAENKLGIPRDWPKDNKWVTIEESDQANCPGCREVNRKRRKKR